MTSEQSSGVSCGKSELAKKESKDCFFFSECMPIIGKDTFSNERQQHVSSKAPKVALVR